MNQLFLPSKLSYQYIISELYVFCVYIYILHADIKQYRKISSKKSMGNIFSESVASPLAFFLAVIRFRKKLKPHKLESSR